MTEHQRHSWRVVRLHVGDVCELVEVTQQAWASLFIVGGLPEARTGEVQVDAWSRRVQNARAQRAAPPAPRSGAFSKIETPLLLSGTTYLTLG